MLLDMSACASEEKVKSVLAPQQPGDETRTERNVEIGLQIGNLFVMPYILTSRMTK